MSVDPYVQRVAGALLRDGFDPEVLAEMKTLGSFSEASRIFRVLAERGLLIEDAAYAIRLSCHLYQEMRVLKEAQGWPLKDESAVQEGCPRHEAYFLELLDEAGSMCDSRRKPRFAA